ncbi:hypothetical protein [Actinomadura keratinilytica]|uniref:Uncharacterized protein n=2 Tax=Actinomadura keratinilytica TaxID=547461 RepID=A0ABP7YGM8_9ACTN
MPWERRRRRRSDALGPEGARPFGSFTLNHIEILRILVRMSQTPNDPAGSTQQFQNFQQQAQPEKAARVNVGLIAGIVAVAALVAIIAIAIGMTM